MEAISNEKISLKHVLEKRLICILLFFRLLIEIDEKWHTDRPENEEKESKKLMQIELGCKFITINPDAEDFDICVEIGKIYSQKRRKMKKQKRKKS